MNTMRKILFGILALAVISACQNNQTESYNEKEQTKERTLLTSKYVPFDLTTDLSVLKESEKAMIPLLIKAADIMDELFWYEAYGDKEALLSSLSDPADIEMAIINYGPWDRLDGNKSFVDEIGEKPLGANFYPADMTKEEFEASDLEDKASLYTFLRRDDQGKLMSIPYHEMFKDKVSQAAFYLEKASELTEDDMLRVYLHKRAKALITDDYQDSDMAWLDMKHNTIDVVIGPIETYEDHIYGYKAAHEAYVLIKDQGWSKRLAKYAQFLPGLQEGLPVDDKYKQEKPGNDVDLNAYDVIYYAGDCNAGSKTIAINLPNDEEVQLKKGTRRLQLKNAMKAKFDKILEPIADVLIDESQRKHITFDAFFSNTMFHEVAHGLGIKNTINDNGTVREALKELSSALEEGKADILGLYMINQLHKMGELDADLKDFYVTFMAGIFRSVRFGASSAHGKANMIRFNYFKEAGAFSKNDETGRYTVNFDKFEKATQSLSELILTIQGDGDYARCKALVESKGIIGSELQADLDKLGDLGIPVDIVFNQGLDVLGLE
jgi:hypothetical protein